VYVCVCVYIYIYIYDVCMYVCMYVHLQHDMAGDLIFVPLMFLFNVYTCAFICMYTCVFVIENLLKYICIHMYQDTDILELHIYPHISTCIKVLTYIHIFIGVHMYTHVSRYWLIFFYVYFCYQQASPTCAHARLYVCIRVCVWLKIYWSTHVHTCIKILTYFYHQHVSRYWLIHVSRY
jgi:hypothetical protein